MLGRPPGTAHSPAASSCTPLGKHHFFSCSTFFNMAGWWVVEIFLYGRLLLLLLLRSCYSVLRLGAASSVVVSRQQLRIRIRSKKQSRCSHQCSYLPTAVAADGRQECVLVSYTRCVAVYSSSCSCVVLLLGSSYYVPLARCSSNGGRAAGACLSFFFLLVVCGGPPNRIRVLRHLPS